MLTEGDKREQGFVVNYNGSFGFIKPTERKDQLFFHISDVKDREEPQRGDEV